MVSVPSAYSSSSGPPYAKWFFRMHEKELTHDIIGARLKCAAVPARTCWSPRTRDVSSVVHQDLKLECGCRLDALVGSKVVAELKAADSLAPVHKAIVLDYLRLSGHRLGLLINFNVNRSPGRHTPLYHLGHGLELHRAHRVWTESTLRERCQEKKFVY